MHKPRRHERIALLADLVIQPGDDQPARFTGEVFNVSRGGVAVFSRHCFAVGKMAGMELTLPGKHGEPPRRVALFGVVRRVESEPDGNVLGIELLQSSRAGDYAEFAAYLDRVSGVGAARPIGARAFTLVEATIAMVIICLIVTLAVPTFRRAVEQARTDSAAVNLMTIWTAQRVYWLEHKTFAAGLNDLVAEDLIDSAVAASQGQPRAIYVYQLTGVDNQSFTARALRNGSGVWRGQLQIDQSGHVTGAIAGPDSQVLTPPS